MFICLDCGKLFEEPEDYVETHGLECGPYEKWSGCPECGGAYTDAYRCEYCDEWIEGDYIKTNYGERFCENCFCRMSLGDED